MCTERISLTKECGWKDGDRGGLAECEQTHGKKKAKYALTSTGLLMEGVSSPLLGPITGGKRIRALFQLCVLGLGGDEHRNVGVGVLPHRQKILVGRARADRIAFERSRACQAQSGQWISRTEGVRPSLIQQSLKFRRRLFSLLGLQVSKSVEIKIVLCPTGQVRSEPVLLNGLKN